MYDCDKVENMKDIKKEFKEIIADCITKYAKSTMLWWMKLMKIYISKERNNYYARSSKIFEGS